MAATKHIILVDENDQQTGTMEKLAAHRLGLRHRAFSVFVFRKTNQTTEVLLQQRAANKYHSANLWTNTCCSHPQPGEEIIQAGERRLFEEMGIKATLQHAGTFHYIANFPNGLAENEIDHVLIATGNLTPTLNPAEVKSFRWISLDELQQEITKNPENFTAWFARALEIALGKLSVNL